MNIDLNKFEVETIRRALEREASDLSMKMAILEDRKILELDVINALLGKIMIFEYMISETEFKEVIRQTDKEYAEGKSVECND